jgi:hypothetical protein
MKVGRVQNSPLEMKQMKDTYKIAIAICILVMAASFITSYFTLVAAVEMHGSKSPYTYPIAIDGCLLLATFARLHFNMIGKNDSKEPLFVLVSFTIISVILNGMEAWPDLEGAFQASIMPLAFLASTEVLAKVMLKQNGPAPKARKPRAKPVKKVVEVSEPTGNLSPA